MEIKVYNVTVTRVGPLFIFPQLIDNRTFSSLEEAKAFSEKYDNEYGAKDGVFYEAEDGEMLQYHNESINDSGQRFWELSQTFYLSGNKIAYTRMVTITEITLNMQLPADKTEPAHKMKRVYVVYGEQGKLMRFISYLDAVCQPFHYAVGYLYFETDPTDLIKEARLDLTVDKERWSTNCFNFQDI